MATKDWESVEANWMARERKQERWILVMGGAGYIGSHTVLQLLTEGYFVIIINNFVNSSEEAVHRMRKLAGELGDILKFFEVRLFKKIDGVQKSTLALLYTLRVIIWKLCFDLVNCI